MVALAEDEKLMTQLFQYRFASGHGLKGHSLGNLFLAALTHLTRDFGQAIRLSSEVLAIRGEIVPSTLSDVRLKARLRGGRVVYGESRITRTRVPIRRLHIIPPRCRPLPETLEAIEAADLITMGLALHTRHPLNLPVREFRRPSASRGRSANEKPDDATGRREATWLRRTAGDQDHGRGCSDLVVQHP
jgi:hypothetical protein